MGGISPVQLFIVPFVFLFALPLAIFAGITTVLAFLVLYLRLTIAYFDVGLDTIRFLILGNGAYNRQRQQQQLASLGGTVASSPTPLSSLGASPRSSSPPGTPASRQYRYGRKGRRGSASSGSLTPVASTSASASTTGFDRDFEGVGGWRIASARSNARADDDDDGDDDDDDDAQWHTLNSRLELPSDRRHHFRSHSGGAVLSSSSSGVNSGAGLYSMATTNGRAGSVSPGALRMTASPNSSRSRTPTSSRPYAAAGLSKFDHDGYFPLQDRKHIKKLSA
ncbi:hypothetical protein SLS62_008536 [Diatrype stigma]|uniref:Uncharacterized protein n=1 Tax=Diatrype stigma TaxID=117547 RepID=A0AAN9UIC3_9PEZI